MISQSLVRRLSLLVVLVVASVGWLPHDALAKAILPQTDAEAAGVQIDQSHVFIVPAGARIQIAEYYLVGNSGVTDYEGVLVDGDVMTTIGFELPEDATALSFDGPGIGERYVGEGRRFADTQPIPPGTDVVEIGFSYEVPLQDEIRLTRSLDVPVASTVILLRGEGLGLTGEGLTYTGDIETGMGAAASYIAEGLESGRTLRVELTSREVAAPTAPSAPMMRTGERQTGVELLIGLLAVGVAGVMVWRLWRSPAIPQMPESVRAIIAEIAALDAGYEQGRIAAELYREEREVLVRKARLWVHEGERAV